MYKQIGQNIYRSCAQILADKMTEAQSVR